MGHEQERRQAARTTFTCYHLLFLDLFPFVCVYYPAHHANSRMSPPRYPPNRHAFLHPPNHPRTQPFSSRAGSSPRIPPAAEGCGSAQGNCRGAHRTRCKTSDSVRRRGAVPTTSLALGTSLFHNKCMYPTNQCVPSFLPRL